MFELATQFAGCHNSSFENPSNSQPSESIIEFLTYVQPIVAVIGIIGNIFVITLLNATSKETACIFYLSVSVFFLPLNGSQSLFDVQSWHRVQGN
nr:hypothetical transcript [Hymenolepis microstoma]